MVPSGGFRSRNVREQEKLFETDPCLKTSYGAVTVFLVRGEAMALLLGSVASMLRCLASGTVFILSYA
jgi:hypothetical protein